MTQRTRRTRRKGKTYDDSVARTHKGRTRSETDISALQVWVYMCPRRQDAQARANLRLMCVLEQDIQRTHKIRNGRKCITGKDLYMSLTMTYKGRTRSETGLGVVHPERPPRRGDSRGCTTTREFS